MWTYDARGQQIREEKIVGSDGIFVTGWLYNSAGLLKSMTYPGGNSRQTGEVVTFRYYPQLTLNTVLSNFPTTYVHHTWYDASGRAVRRAFWLNGDVETRYTYNAWSTQGGRLYRLQSGLDEDVTTLQNLFYT
jgi:hypothetical protein